MAIKTIRYTALSTISDLRELLEEHWLSYEFSKKFVSTHTEVNTFFEIRMSYSFETGEHTYSIDNNDFKSLEGIYHYAGQIGLLKVDNLAFAYRVRVGKHVVVGRTCEEFDEFSSVVGRYILADKTAHHADHELVYEAECNGKSYEINQISNSQLYNWVSRYER